MSWYRFWVKLAKPFCQILWPVQIIDRHKFSEGKGVYVCNHYSYFDPVHFVTDMFEGRLNILAKEESMQSPIGRKFLGYIGAIPVKRGEADLRAMKACMTVLREDKPLVIFPEGTRNKAGTPKMLDFKDGPVMFALKTGAPIYPFMYHHPIRLFRKTYLIVGDRIDMTAYSGQSVNTVREEATLYVRQSMQELWDRLDSIVSNPALLREAKRQDRIERRRIKVANRKAQTQSKRARKNAKNIKVDSN